jgi:hypothetical protein
MPARNSVASWRTMLQTSFVRILLKMSLSYAFCCASELASLSGVWYGWTESLSLASLYSTTDTFNHSRICLYIILCDSAYFFEGGFAGQGFTQSILSQGAHAFRNGGLFYNVRAAPFGY